MPNVTLDRLRDERSQQIDLVESLLAVTDGDDEHDPRDLVPTELELVSRAQARVAELDAQIAPLVAFHEIREASTAASGAVRSVRTTIGTSPGLTPTGAPGDPVYRTFAHFARDEIIARFDKVANRAGNGAREAAQERLTRAVANTLMADIPGLLPPQHMGQILDVINKSRPIVEASRRAPLNAGKLTYPRIDQRPLVGVQATEKTELPSQAMKVSMQNITAKVFGGCGDLSWQDVAWSNPDALSLWFDLAAEAYARETETEAATVLLAGITAAPIVVGTPDLAGWAAALAAAAGEVYAASWRRPDTLFTSLTDGYALLSLVGQTTPAFLAPGSGSLATGQGNILGFRLVMSPEMPAGTAVVGDSSSFLVAETPGAPVELRAVEPSIAGFEVGIVGGFAAAVTVPDAFRKLTAPAPLPLGGGGTSTPASGK